MSVSERLRWIASRRWTRNVHRTSSASLWSISFLAIGVLALLLAAATGTASGVGEAFCVAGLMVLTALAGVLAELRRVATTDALTGLANRGQFFMTLDTMTARARRKGVPLSLAILDVDRFKSVNDAHGHPAGDAVLRTIAQRLKRAVRAGDLVGRIGGEEFAVLMSDTGQDEARAVCDHLRQVVAARDVLLPCGTAMRITLSAGVALMAGESSADMLVSIADAALYKAKLGGRNQVRLAA